MDNQNYSNEQDRSKTRVLSDDERRQFDGVTIEETQGTVHVDKTPMDQQTQYNQNEDPFAQYTNPRVKVIHFGGSSWLSRIIIIAILAAIAAIVVFFGGIIVTVIGAIMLVGAIISFIFGLF